MRLGASARSWDAEHDAPLPRCADYLSVHGRDGCWYLASGLGPLRLQHEQDDIDLTQPDADAESDGGFGYVQVIAR